MPEVGDNALRELSPSEAVRLADVPLGDVDALGAAVAARVSAGAALSALFGWTPPWGGVRLVAVVSDPERGRVAVGMADVVERYAAWTPMIPAAHWFERELAEQWGVVPDGHPRLKPIRFHRSYRPGHDAWNRGPNADILPCVTQFDRVEGSEVHEVAVGPVHAGVIEPGHFRFQCHGEHVFNLEISLGYQHRGVERSLIGGPTKRTIQVMETTAGDTSIGHATAYCQAVEALAGCRPPLRAQWLRALALELERMANHTGDLGALADDVGFLPTASFCGRLRGEYLNLTALVCGSRFGRGLVRPGGVAFDVEPSRVETMRTRLGPALRDTAGAAQLLWDTSSVRARFEDTGRVSPELAREIGLVGPAARASGLTGDVRYQFPTGYFRYAYVPVSTWHSGDVFGRAFVRHLEIQRSGEFLLEQLAVRPESEIRLPVGPLAPESLAVSLVEGWRGEICHVALTDAAGRLAHYKVVDPSFHNWFGLAMALRDQQISDFPLCNKSFNLSYCGHDL